MVLLILHIAGFLLTSIAVIFMVIPHQRMEKSLKMLLVFGIMEASMVFFAMSVAFEMSRLWG